MTKTQKTNYRKYTALLVLLVCLTAANLVNAQTSAFTYQGRLTDNSMPPTGTYDFQFKVFTALTGGAQQGVTVTRTAVQVTNGVFTVVIDPTVPPLYPFASGDNRYLEISIRLNGSGTGYTPLTPRQQITSAPFATQSFNAQNANSLNGFPAEDFVMADDSRLTDARNPLGGSTNYVQNTTTTQAATNFNISGNGTLGGTIAAENGSIGSNLVVDGNISTGGTLNTFNAAVSNNLSVQGNVNAQGIFTGNGSGITSLNANSLTSGTVADLRLTPNIPRLNAANNFSGTQSAEIFNATTQFRIGGNRFLSAIGTNNVFVGVNAGGTGNTGSGNTFVGRDAGIFNTSGASNVFIGASAGYGNETGSGNTFVGTGAGNDNEAGSSNSFFGISAGANTTGNENTFIGRFAGTQNTTGSNNTLLGEFANVPTNSNLSYATAIGSGSIVAASDTIALGRNSGADKVVIYGLGAAGSTSLCRNALNQISTCTPGNFAENAQTINALREENARTIEQLKRQQIIIDELKQTVCSIKPDAAVCRQEEK